MQHTYCTDLEAASVPINVIQYLMGHSSIELTSRIDTRVRNDTLERAAHKVASFGIALGATTGATDKGQLSVLDGESYGAIKNTITNQSSL